VLGIVHMNDLVDKALESAVPPILKDTFEVACKVVEDGARSVRGEMRKLKGDIDALGDPVKDAYSSLGRSLDDLDNALAPLAPTENGPPPQCDPQAVTQVVAKTRNLIGEIDRLAAAPLAPLMGIVDQKISEATDELSKGIADYVEKPFAQLAAGTRIDALSDVLLPIGGALALMDQFEKLNAIQPAIINAIETTAKDSFASNLPPTLKDFRDLWISKLITGLDALRSGQPADVVTEINSLEQALRQFGGSPPPDVLEKLYETAIALRTSANGLFDAATLKQLVSKELRDELLFWWGRSAAPTCVQILNALKAVRLAVVAKSFDSTVCTNADLCVDGKNPPVGPAGGLCLLLWQLCQDVPGLSPSSIRLAQSYAALARAATELVQIENDSASKCSDPANFDQVRRDLTRDLQRLGAARRKFIESLTAWVGDLAPATKNQLSQAAALRIGAAAAKALGVLTPSASDVSDLVDKLKPLIGESAAGTLKQQIDAMIARWTARANAFADASSLDDLRKAADDLKQTIGDISTQAVADAENAITQAILRAALPPVAAADATVTQLLQVVDAGYAQVKQARDSLRDGPAGLRWLQGQLQGFGITITGEPLETILNVSKDDGLSSVCGGTPDEPEGLDQEVAAVYCIAGLPPGLDRISVLVSLFDKWSDTRPALVRLITGLGQRAKQVMTLAPQVHFVDVTSLRQSLSELLQDAVPTMRHLEYSWDLPLNTSEYIPIGTDLVKFELPDNLTLSAKTDIDLTKSDQAPKFEVNGRLGGFKVNIWKEAVVLKFHPFVFTAGSGRSPHFSADLAGVEIGAALAFLTALAVYFQAQSGNPSADSGDGVLANGPYIVPRTAGPGIKAGYRLALGDVEIGNLAIFGMNFDAHCEMPFDGARGAVRISLASPEAPFLVTFAPYGGRGHFLLEGGPDETRGARFDVGFQYGGAVAVKFGPLVGSAVVMVGFRVVNQQSDFEFSGFFVAAFEGQVACFGVAVCFSVTMRYAGGSMSGEAMLSFEFSCGPAKIKYQVAVNHNSGGKIGESAWLEPTFEQPHIVPAGLQMAPAAIAVSRVPALLEDWRGYRARYDFKVRAAGRRRRK